MRAFSNSNGKKRDRKTRCYNSLVDLPRLLLVRQNFPARRLQDIPSETQRRLVSTGFASRLRPGSRVAIGVGSRGIANIDVIVRSVVDYWKSSGMRPFIFPAMGSHGAATAEGQAAVLARYGIHEAGAGCPVVSSLEVVELGTTPEGIKTYLDRAAFDSDGIFLVNRVKWHTDFAGKIESGLYKMMAIGLGKLAGARQYHTFGYKLGLERVIRAIGREVLNSGKILGGLAILEDACHRTAQLTPVPVECMEAKEEELLALAKAWMPRIPARAVDILIVDEMGKEISGTGMDMKVINRAVDASYNPWDTAPRIERVFVRDLSALTYGNAAGVGVADVVTDRLAAKIDWEPTRINCLTASTLPSLRLPVHFPTDRECLEALAPSVGKLDTKTVTLAWIRNTLELGVLAMSENLRPELEKNPSLEIVGCARDIEFDPQGNLIDPKSDAGLASTAIAN